MDGLSDRGAILPLSDLWSIESVLMRTATDKRPTPAEEGESGSFDSRGERGDSADLSEEGAALAAAEESEAAPGGDEPAEEDNPPTRGSADDLEVPTHSDANERDGDGSVSFLA